MNTPRAQLDHLVVACAALEDGVRWCEEALGVTPGPGGKHPLMGTHNRLLLIAGSDFPGAYLELIAIDPAAPAPGRRRWFGLDQRDPRAAPSLVHWAVRTGDVRALCDAVRAHSPDPGEPVAASRETPHGLLRWQITLRDDGVLQAGGALPTLIQWDSPHPTQHMADAGVMLEGLTLGGLPTAAMELLAMRGLAAASQDSAPALRATFSSPRGRVLLESAA